MIARLIAWSARNLMLVFIATAFAVVAGMWARADAAARRHSRSLGHAGHRLHRVPGPGAAGGRGPGHLSADHVDADRAALEGRARLLVLRRVVRLRHLRGRHRHLLGALARARISQRRRQALAGRRHPDARARRQRRRLGLPVRGAGQEQVAGRACARCRTGRSASACPRPKASPRSPASAASSSSTTSSSIPAACARSAFRSPKSATSFAAATWMSAGARSSLPSTSSWCAAAAISKASTTSRSIVVKADGGTPVLLKDVARVELGRRRAARHRRAQRRRRGGERHRLAALRRQRADRHRQRQGAAARRSRRRCPRARRSCRSTTAPS